MSKRKKVNILKRMPNGSVISVYGSDNFYEATIDGHPIWYGVVSRAMTDLISLEMIIKSLGAAYQALEIEHEDYICQKKEGA